MKNKSVLLFFLTLLLSTGCSSVNTIKDFSSRQEFYKNFNRLFHNKCAKAELLNDSVIVAEGGAMILNDTLYALKRSGSLEPRKISVNEIKVINYPTNNYKEAVLVFKNGGKFYVKDIKTGHDSLEFNIIHTIVSPERIAPVDKVKSVSYKNNWNGIFPGAVTGFIAGTIAGVYSSLERIHNQQYNFDMEVFTVSGICILAGSIAGSFVGWRYVYEFNIPY
jgi:hypothetical protein